MTELLNPADGSRFDVFVSYMREDAGVAKKLVTRLARGGFTAWLDETGLSIGCDWEQSIKSALTRSDFFLPMFTKAYARRPDTFMVREFEFAELESRGRDQHHWCLPVLVGSADLPDLSAGAVSIRRFHAVRVSRALEPFWKIEAGLREKADLVHDEAFAANATRYWRWEPSGADYSDRSSYFSADPIVRSVGGDDIEHRWSLYFTNGKDRRRVMLGCHTCKVGTSGIGEQRYLFKGVYFFHPQRQWIRFDPGQVVFRALITTLTEPSQQFDQEPRTLVLEFFDPHEQRIVTRTFFQGGEWARVRRAKPG